MFFNRKTKKAALDLSVGFLVKLILAIVVFSMGMIIVRNIFSTASSGDLTRGVDDEVELQIRTLMDTGDKVVMFPEEIETTRNNVAIFGLGILNVLNAPGDTDFNIQVQCHEFIPRNSNQRLDCTEGGDYESWTFADFPSVSLARNDEETVSIPILPSGAELGTYIYNVRVFFGDPEETYGIVKFRVNVR